MMFNLPEALSSLVEAKYQAAKASQAVVFSATELSIIRTSAGIPFQLRYCPSLAKKSEPLKDKTPRPKVDVFENPPPELFLADLPNSLNPSHFLVLNKYPVIPNHFILATKKYKPQTHNLEEDDLEAAYACLKAWQTSRQKRLFAFFNSGQHSGASQPHRHLQFLDIDSMHEGEESAGWDILLDKIMSSEEHHEGPPDCIQYPELPFSHFAYQFTSEPSGAQLLQAYNQLYQLAKEAVDKFIAANPDQLTLHTTPQGDLPISYNMAMTTAGIAILPRRSEGHMLRRDDGSNIGYVQLNGTALGGTLMVKYKEEWDTLRTQPQKLDAILEAIGIPRQAQTTKL